MKYDFGVRCVGFFSVVLGTTSAIVCGWIFLSHEFGYENTITRGGTNATICQNLFPPSSILSSAAVGDIRLTDIVDVDKDEDFVIPESSSIIQSFSNFRCLQYLIQFLGVLMQNCFIVTIASTLQVVSSASMIVTPKVPKQGMYWVILNMGFTLVYLVCFISVFTLSKQTYTLLTIFNHLFSYYVVLFLNIILGSALLICMMLLLTYKGNSTKVGYALMV